jgi:hypothetical protein
MKVMIVLFAMFAAAPPDLSDFVWHVHILAVEKSAYSEHGYGNMSAGTPLEHGFEFVGDCKFEPTRGDTEFYRGKVDGDKHTLTLAVSKIGETKIKTCTVKFSPKGYRYDVDANGRLTTVPLK